LREVVECVKAPTSPLEAKRASQPPRTWLRQNDRVAGDGLRRIGPVTRGFGCGKEQRGAPLSPRRVRPLGRSLSLFGDRPASEM
jgi:hypothetical protein